MKIDKLVRYAAGFGLVGAMFVACTGDLTFDPPLNPGPDAPVVVEPQTAREYFDQKVAPFVQAANQCSCHGAGTAPIFKGLTVDDTYDLLKADYPSPLVGNTPAESTFYTKAQSPHYGAEWKDNQAQYVYDWITWEYNEYNPPEPSPGRQRFDTYIAPLLAKCSGCHGNQAPAFVKPTPAESYAFLMTGYPSTLVNTTAAESRFYAAAYPNAHYGTIWVADDATAIEAWIAEEYADSQQ
jgi:hypothetical protein